VLRKSVQSNKKSDLPVGVYEVIRYRKGKRPYLEFQVSHSFLDGKHRTAHFYVGVESNATKWSAALAKAVQFRKDYEDARNA
jgi:hypothetical protein